MSKLRVLQFLFGLTVIAFTPFSPAHAQNFETWVSGLGQDTNPCTRTAPCATLGQALSQTNAGGQINILDPGEFGSVVIDRAITISNDTSGTASVCCQFLGSAGNTALIIIAAGTGDVVTLHGLTINEQDFVGSRGLGASGIAVSNAKQVNIEKTTIRNSSAPGILVAPSGGQFAPSIDVNIADTTVTGNAGGMRVLSVPGLTVNTSIARSLFTNNSGGGIRLDGTGGGLVIAWISDTVSSMNNGNGVIAISGIGNAAAHITRSVIAGNAAFGVQSNQTNGGLAAVTVESSKIMNNASGQVEFIAGGTLLTAGNNLLVGGQGTGFTGPIALQ